MEAMGGSLFLDGEWESLCKMFTTEQDPAFEQVLGHNQELPKDHLPDDQGLISLLMGEPINPISPFFTQMPNSNHFSQTSSSDLSYDSSNGGSPHYVNGCNNLMQPNYNVNDDQISCLPSFDFLMEDGLLMGQLGFPTLIEGPSNDKMDRATGDHSPSAKRNFADDHLEMEADVHVPKKRARVSKRANKGKAKTQPEKNKNEGVEEETSEALNGQNTSGDMSDNESNASQEVINEAQKETLNMNGKKRANRGAATDPQSLYARRRRERINERLRILQTLVPNGTKVDISTMLEEAVHYVKFLQLQIKLLSSDEMWMYAPLAYNGFDMGLYKRFSPYMLRP